ncbi:MAG: cytochrome PufQ [Pseudomonadota bacterium]
MTDFTSGGGQPRISREPGVEYRLYFAIIFVISLPWAFVSWALGLVSPQDEEHAGKGFIGRAWLQASVITPQIFKA